MSWHANALPGRRHAHEVTPVGPGEPHPRDDLVTARDDVFRVHAQIRERGELHAEEGLDPVLRRRQARRFLVLDEVVRESAANPSISPALIRS